MNPIIERLSDLTRRHAHFTYDLRGACLVYQGVVAAYKGPTKRNRFTDLAKAIAHALAHDGIIGAWRDPRTGEVDYDSCRLFTDVPNALRFAKAQGQEAIFNLNRDQEVRVPADGSFP